MRGCFAALRMTTSVGVAALVYSRLRGNNGLGGDNDFGGNVDRNGR
jgi:hypothetical protein